MDTALRNATAKRDALEARLSEIDREINTLQSELSEANRFIQDWYKFAEAGADTSRDIVAIPSLKNDTAPPPRKKRAMGNPKKEDVAEVTRAIALQTNAPVPREELIQYLTAQGMTFAGEDPMKVLSTMLWRMSNRVVNLRGYGYWPADKPYEPAKYNPWHDLV